MQYAFVDGDRRQAFVGGRGLCPTCGAAMIAKCGPRILHHWAHAGRRNCDPWWENETEWHREWKNLFPESWREISHVAPDGEIHRADIKTPTGIVIEVQHSAMTDLERQSREAFYGNLVWVIDGRGFRDNIDIYHLLPSPDSEIAQDLVWCKASRRMQGAARGLFFRVSEGHAEFPDETITKATTRGGFYHGIHEIRAEVGQAYRAIINMTGCGRAVLGWMPVVPSSSTLATMAWCGSRPTTNPACAAFAASRSASSSMTLWSRPTAARSQRGSIRSRATDGGCLDGFEQ